MTLNNRLSLPHIHRLVGLGLILSAPVSVWAQAVVASIPVSGIALAFNPVTNTVDVAAGSACSLKGSCTIGNVAVADLATDTASLMDPNAINPRAVAVNPATNKIYVADSGSFDRGIAPHNPGKVTVFDGATNTATDIIDPNADGPVGIAVNPTTNKIYVANARSGNVTVIDGATNATTTLTDPNAVFPFAVAVNSATNRIYVANQGNLSSYAANPGNVTVIDGATGRITTVTDPNAYAPDSLAVNSVTNKVYVANMGNFLFNGSNLGNVTVIDGATNTTTTITDPNATTPGGGDCRGFGVAVNSATNKVYVVNEYSHNVTIIDGASNATTTVSDPSAWAPIAVAVDSVTNKIYVANIGNDDSGGAGESVTVIDGASNSMRTVTDPNMGSPQAVTVDPATNRIYAAGASLTVIDGGATFTPPSDFSLKAISAAVTLQPGGNVSDAITISSFGSAIQLTCAVAGPSPAPTCSLSAATVTPGASSVTSTLSIAATSTSAMQAPLSHRQPWLLGALSISLFGIVLVGGSRRSHRTAGGLILLLVLQVGCASSGATHDLSDKTQAPTNYTVTVTGTSGSIQHTTQVAVTIE
jgi:YVTN family beta-propeller protein